MNEVSKLGQPEEEPIEGRIVGDYEGPGFNYWDIINEQVRQMFYRGSYHSFVDGDTIIAPGGWSVPKEQEYEYDYFERSPDFEHQWAAFDLTTKSVTTEFPEVSNELFSIMTEIPRIDLDLIGVHVALGQANEDISAPPVDPDKVKWPTNGRMPWTRTRKQ